MTQITPPQLDLLHVRNLRNQWVAELHKEMFRLNPVPRLYIVKPLRYRVKETDNGYIELNLMIFNWQLVLGDDWQDTQGYCYLGPDSTRNALHAALEWDGTGVAPGPWYKAVHTQETRQEHFYR